MGSLTPTQNEDQLAELACKKTLSCINVISNIIRRSYDLTDLLGNVCRELINIFHLGYANIAIFNSDKSELNNHVRYSNEREDNFTFDTKYIFQTSDDFAAAIRSGEPIIIESDMVNSILKLSAKYFKIDESYSVIIFPLQVNKSTIGLIILQAKERNNIFSSLQIQLANTIAQLISAAVENISKQEKAEMDIEIAERDLEIGSQIQSGFFPKEIPNIPGWEFSTYFSPARQVSGDFFDMFYIGDKNHLCIVVADVCDKGVGAALFMVLLRTLIRSFSTQLQSNFSLKDLLHHISVNVNHYIVTTHGHSNMFATMFICILDCDSDKLFYVNGGHDPAILLDLNGNIKNILEPTSPAFGFTTDLEFNVDAISLKHGDILLAYTDGLTEAKNSDDQFYSEERLMNRISKPWSSLLSLAKHLEVDIYSHIGFYPQYDDITFVALRKSTVNKPAIHEFTQKAVMNNLPFFKGFTVEACQKLNINDDTIESVKLVIDEICSNIIMHGFKDGEAGDINLIIKEGKSELIFEVNDRGRSFNPLEYDPPKLDNDINKRDIGKLGVYFIKEMVDEINYKSNGGLNCLTFKIRY
jgi:serine phosphatase RsbU (regulator of sigma subunit)/anti-sigma regulatory factor (Ser/Thr protein kinase)